MILGTDAASSCTIYPCLLQQPCKVSIAPIMILTRIYPNRN